MRAVARVLAMAAVVVVASAGWLVGCAHRPAVTAAVIPAGELPDLHKAGLAQLWQRLMPLDPGERIENIYRVGLSVYVTTSSSRVTRIDAKTGELKWSQGLGKENFDLYKPIELHNPDGPSKEVLVVTRGDAFTFDIETGDESRPKTKLGLSVSCDPTVIGNTLIVGGADTLYGLYLDRPDLRRWVVKSRGDVFDSTPVTQGSDVLAASRKGQLWRVNGATGEWQWKDRKTNGEVVAGLLADSNALYVPCLDQRVYAFGTDSGGELWETQLAGRLEDVPAAAGAQICVISKESGAYGLLRGNGEIKWHMPDVNRVLASEDESIWVSTDDGYIESLAVNDGTILTKAKATGVGMFVRNAFDKSVILATPGGMIGLYTHDENRKSADPD